MVDKRYVFWSVRWYTSVYCEHAMAAGNMMVLSSLCPRRNPRRERRSFRATPSQPIERALQGINHVERSRRSPQVESQWLSRISRNSLRAKRSSGFLASQSLTSETLYHLRISEDLTFPLIIKELNERRAILSLDTAKFQWVNASQFKVLTIEPLRSNKRQLFSFLFILIRI